MDAEKKENMEEEKKGPISRREALKRIAKIGIGVAGASALASCDWLFYYDYSDYYNYYYDYYSNYYSDYYAYSNYYYDYYGNYYAYAR